MDWGHGVVSEFAEGLGSCDVGACGLFIWCTGGGTSGRGSGECLVCWRRGGSARAGRGLCPRVGWICVLRAPRLRELGRPPAFVGVVGAGEVALLLVVFGAVCPGFGFVCFGFVRIACALSRGVAAVAFAAGCLFSCRCVCGWIQLPFSLSLYFCYVWCGRLMLWRLYARTLFVLFCRGRVMPDVAALYNVGLLLWVDASSWLTDIDDKHRAVPAGFPPMPVLDVTETEWAADA